MTTVSQGLVQGAHLGPVGCEMLPESTCFLSRRLEGRQIEDRGGRGVFAREPIAAGEVVAVWGGEVVTGDWLRRNGPEWTRVSLQIEDDLFLVAQREGPADWVNHSCEPNAGMRGQIVLVAMRDIETGEEICYDYSMTDASDYDVLDCRCGTPSCRGRISGRDWRKPELAHKYRGYFSPYIQQLIDREQSRQSRTLQRAKSRTSQR